MSARPSPIARPLSWPWSPGNTATTKPPSAEERQQSTELYSLDVFSFLLTNSLILASLVGDKNVLQTQEKLTEAASAVPWRPFALKWEVGKYEAYMDIWGSYNLSASQARKTGPGLFAFVTVHAIAPARTEQVHSESVAESTSTSTSRQSVRPRSMWSEMVAIPEGGVDFYHHTPAESGHCGRVPHGVGGKRTAIGALLGFFKCVRSHRAQDQADAITLYGAAQDGANCVLLKLTPNGTFYQHTLRLAVGGHETFQRMNPGALGGQLAVVPGHKRM